MKYCCRVCGGVWSKRSWKEPPLMRFCPHCGASLKGKVMSTQIDVLKCLSAQVSVLGDHSITMDPELASSEGVSVGQQVRIKVKDDTTKYAAYTVNQLYQDGSDNDDVRMALAGRQRLDESNSFDAYLEGTGYVALTGKTDSWLNDNDEFGEFLDETSSTQDDMVICAPHGGMIENHTDEQAQWCYDRLTGYHSKDASAWYCVGHQDAIGAYDAWHITSTLISSISFQYLNQIKNRGENNGFGYAVSFHGCSGDTIYVGGRADSTLKNAVKTAIENVVGEAYDVEVVTSGEFAGTDEDNFINWLTDSNDRSVQIEQPYGARSSYGQDIAEAVADVFATYL